MDALKKKLLSQGHGDHTAHVAQEIHVLVRKGPFALQDDGAIQHILHDQWRAQLAHFRYTLRAPHSREHGTPLPYRPGSQRIGAIEANRLTARLLFTHKGSLRALPGTHPERHSP